MRYIAWICLFSHPFSITGYQNKNGVIIACQKGKYQLKYFANSKPVYSGELVCTGKTGKGTAGH
jgi:hypothetical protein